MGKNTNPKRYEKAVQLLLAVLSFAVLLLAAFKLMDLELFSVSKLTMVWSSIKPWLYPPYVYLLINFIIIFIFASSFIHSNTINPANDHMIQSYTDSIIESSLVSQDDLTVLKEDTCKDVIDHRRELRKSKTFHEGGGSRPISRTERYVRILSQDELDRRVEAFICRFKKDNKSLEFGRLY